MSFSDERQKRLAVLQTRMAAANIDAALLVLSRDIFYYTGTAQPCVLVVTPDDYLLIVRRAPDFVARETWLPSDKTMNGGSFKEATSFLASKGVTKGNLSLELDVIPAELFLKLSKTFSSFAIVNISDDIAAQRMTKDAGEIALIRNACVIMNSGHKRVMEVLTDGMTELELAAEVECAHRKAGHEGVLSMRNFDFYISRGPLSSGDNLFKVSGFSNTVTGVGLSAAVPAGPSMRAIRTGDSVITDIPTCCGGYHCDETRTYVLGRPSTGTSDLFKALREISDDVLGAMREGAECRSLWDIASSRAARLGVDEYFLGLPPRKGNFIGHGIGLDANEPPILFDKSPIPLKRGYVVTLELHLTHPKYGAVKLEDMVLIEKNGCQVLSLTERDLFEIDRRTASTKT